MMHRGLFAALCVACVTASVRAQFQLDWYTIDGGGETFVTGGGFEVGGTIGQPDAGAPMVGGDFEVIGGFWASPPCPGDLNGDLLVDITDLSTLLSNFGTPSGATPADGDSDGDTDVDLSDLTTLLSNFGTTCF